MITGYAAAAAAFEAMTDTPPAIGPRPDECFVCGQVADHAGPPVYDGQTVECAECARCHCGAPAVELDPHRRCAAHRPDPWSMTL